MRAISLSCFKAYTDHLKRSGRNFLVPYINKVQFTASCNSTFSQLTGYQPFTRGSKLLGQTNYLTEQTRVLVG